MKMSYMCGVMLGLAVLNHGVSVCMQQPKGQMVKFEVSKHSSGSNKGLPRDVVFGEVAPRADFPTQLNIRATCHDGEKNVKIDKLIADKQILINPLAFGLHYRKNATVGDFLHLKKICELSEIEGNSRREKKELRQTVISAIDPREGGCNVSHVKRLGYRPNSIGFIALQTKENAQFKLMLEENGRGRGDCTIL